MSLYIGKDTSNNKLVHLTSGTYTKKDDLRTTGPIDDTIVHSSLPYISVVNTEVLVNTSSNLNTPVYPFSSTAHKYFADTGYMYLMLYNHNSNGVYYNTPMSTFFNKPDLSTNTINGISYVGDNDAGGILLVQFLYYQSSDSTGITVTDKDIVVNGISLLGMSNMVFSTNSTPVSSAYESYALGDIADYMHVLRNGTTFSDSSLELTSNNLLLKGSLNGSLNVVIDSANNILPLAFSSYTKYTITDFTMNSINEYTLEIGNNFRYLFIYLDAIVDGEAPTSYQHSSCHMSTILPSNTLVSTLLKVSTSYSSGNKKVTLEHDNTTLSISIISQKNDQLDKLNVQILKIY